MKLDHIGVAVRAIDPALKLFAGALGGRPSSRETIESMKLEICKIDVGGAVIELLEPKAGEETVSKFLANRGEGIHHLCWAVPDLVRAQAELAAKGYRPIWDKPRLGSRRRPVIFFQPRDTCGVLVELTQGS